MGLMVLDIGFMTFITDANCCSKGGVSYHNRVLSRETRFKNLPVPGLSLVPYCLSFSTSSSVAYRLKGENPAEVACSRKV